MFCSNCGSSNSDSSKFCTECGAPLARNDQSTATLVKEGPIEQAGENRLHDPVKAEEFYKAAIGPHNQDYYLKKFARFDSGEDCWSWNWAPFFLTFHWLIYRKMWLNALIYFLLPYVAAILLASASVASGSDSDIMAVGSFLYIAATFIFPPMYADTLYHRYCKKKIEVLKLNSSFSDDASRLSALRKSGGVSKIMMVVGALFVSITLIGIAAAVAIPAYQTYVDKTKAAEHERSNVALPIEQASKVTGNAGLQYNTLFIGTIYNGSDYELRNITVEITAKEKDGTVRWARKFVDRIYISPLTTGPLQISVGNGAEGADIEWAIVEVKGIAPGGNR